MANMTFEEIQAFQAKLRTFLKDEKALLSVTATERGQSGTLFGGGAQNRTDKTNLPQVALTAEHYNRIARLLQHNTAVQLIVRYPHAVRRQHEIVQRGRGDSRKCEERRTGDGGRPLRFVALRHGRDGQCRGQRGRDGSDAHPEDAECEDGSHGAHGAMVRRRGGAARLARLCEAAFRGSHGDEADPGACEPVGLFQYRQRHRADPRNLPAGQ